ncbi:hypothetical protein CVT26_015030 [Gymnopilus dilepis]|uniref:JmjC domain-containing protein n=1 Tax=Gymnopilus dilepis TaxID=231916 RepID=A0A409X3W2_9AGAR|nr:hypothetical protein CVT26_015030 [Gymnopilus dilepis]
MQASSSRSGDVPRSYSHLLGHHTEAIDALLEKCRALPLFERQEQGILFLEALKTRERPFVYTEGFFDHPDHPIKKLPYPKGQPVPAIADVLHDIDALPPGTEGRSIDLITSHDASISSQTVSGNQMVDTFLNFTLHPTEENYNLLRLPFSTPVCSPCTTTSRGVGKVDTEKMVPLYLLKKGETFTSEEKGWSTVFVVSPGLTPIHQDHTYSGQVMVHFFGEKVWAVSAPDDQNMPVFLSDMAFCDDENTKEFFDKVENLVVIVCKEPCLLILPPHCFHAVLTLDTAAHMGTRSASTVWLEQMKIVAKHWTSPKNVDLVKKQDSRYIRRALADHFFDIQLWVVWFRNLNRPPTRKEQEVVGVLLQCRNALTEWVEEFDVRREIGRQEERERMEEEREEKKDKKGKGKNKRAKH